jgi:hypothetical protein
MENCSSGEISVGMYKLKEALEKFCCDLLTSHQRRCYCALAGMVTWRFFSRWKVMESLLMGIGYKPLHSVNYHDSHGYQSHVDRRNASLVRRVIFWRLFCSQNYFTPPFFKTSSLLLILSGILLFLAPLLWKRIYWLSSNLPQKFWHLQVHIFTSKHLNEVWRCNEGPTKDETSLSSRLNDSFEWRDRIIRSRFTTS